MMHKIKLIPTQLMQICHTSYQHLHQWLNIYVQHHHHQQFQGQTKATEQLQSPNPKEIHPDLTSIAIKTITAPGQAVQNFKVDSQTWTETTKIFGSIVQMSGPR
jgi:hypothetical protein